MWGALYAVCGVVQFVAGIYFMLELPIFQLGSNIWTGAWVSTYVLNAKAWIINVFHLHLSHKRGGWNKRGGGAKVPELINEVVGINVEGWKNSISVSLSPFIREIWVRGHSKTTWTNFCPIYLPIVDFRGHLVHHLPFVYVVIEENWPPLLLHMWIWQYI